MMQQHAAMQETVHWDAEDLILTDLVKTFHDGHGGTFNAVNHVSLTIPKGKIVTLLGPSGCGKTTTLRMVAGFEHPDAGEIYLGERKMNGVPAFDRNMPMVFQSYALFPHLTIFENVAYGLRVRKMPKEVITREVEAALQLVNLEKLSKRYPGEISGGQQQRVALARALVLKPKIILFDEPLSNLDAKLRVQTRMEIRRVQQRLRITSLYVTHDQSEALSLSDYIVVMNKGEIEQMGTPEEIYNHPNSLFVADFLGNANFIEATVAEVHEKEIGVRVQDQAIRIAANRAKEALRPGDSALLVIKPEAIRVSKNGGGFHGILRSKFFEGSQIEYEVEFEQKTIRAIHQNTEDADISFEPGESVSIHFNPVFFHLFKKPDSGQ
ncbi:ABC transporter related protein [Candidatus Moduliflexus flocculans]|uniref:ABC transporter related protein n=1 Tax=Candidatus Moduliflexus flocculans TaxID=1499966 RepID=A0A0S6VY64_9BACT|nr:ABC transporter related protein [Candidatus Moduliflexus flocculans]